jgi:hypothetical protein
MIALRRKLPRFKFCMLMALPLLAVHLPVLAP